MPDTPEANERTLPTPDMEGDYRTFWPRLLNQEIQKNTIILLDREGINTNKKDYKLETNAPNQLAHLLRLKSKRDNYYGIIEDLLTVTKECQTKFIISHISASTENRKQQQALLIYELISEVKSKVVGSYSMTLPQGGSPKIDFKAKRGLGYKKIPKWVFRIEKAGDRDFEIIRDTTDFMVAKDPIQALQKKEYVEHQKQIAGNKYIDDYSQEAREIEAKARARLLKDWPGINVDYLD